MKSTRVEPTHGVRVHFAEPPDAPQVQALCDLYPGLARLSAARLRTELAKQAVFTVGVVVSREEGEALVERAMAAGLDAELFGACEYDSSYLRKVLPAPPSAWASADTSLELVFRPAFTPEVILRLWASDTRAWLQLASSHNSVYVGHFNAPGWLLDALGAVGKSGRGTWAKRLPSEPDEIEAERGTPAEEMVESPSFEDLLDAVVRLPTTHARRGIDGLFVDVDARRGSEHASRSFWSPRRHEHPDAYAVLDRALAAAGGCLARSESHRRVDELSRHLR
ncbi:MAG: hypothetical protein R3B99_08215 [Polyangiales bacterium]